MSTIPSVSTSNFSSSLLPTNIGVAKTNNTSLVRAATSLSMESNILSSMNGGSASSDPVGLLNSFIQPFDTSSMVDGATNNPAAVIAANQGSIDQALLGGMATDPLLNATYNGSGAVQSQPSASSTSWASVVKNNPNGAAAMTSAAVNSSILSQLSTYA